MRFHYPESQLTMMIAYEPLKVNPSRFLVNIKIGGPGGPCAWHGPLLRDRSLPEREGLPHALPGRETNENACPEGSPKGGLHCQNQLKS